jgi:hypothetical protein
MAESSWGDSWGESWGHSWGTVVPEEDTFYTYRGRPVGFYDDYGIRASQARLRSGTRVKTR